MTLESAMNRVIGGHCRQERERCITGFISTPRRAPPAFRLVPGRRSSPLRNLWSRYIVLGKEECRFHGVENQVERQK